MSDGWLQVAREALKIPGLLLEVYGDLAKPGVTQAGKALETVIGLGNTILWPIALANERSRMALERNLEKYRLEMQLVPDEKVVSIAPEIGVPIAEKLSYVTDEHLSTLYVKLLAAASNRARLSTAHPSFVNIINNLSPDEAVLLKHFISTDSIPIVNAWAVDEVKNIHSVISGPITSFSVSSQLIFPDNCEAYLSNLAGLGLVDIRHDKSLSPASIYESIHKQHEERLLARISSFPQFATRTLDFKNGVAIRTSFGRQFIEACHGGLPNTAS